MIHKIYYGRPTALYGTDSDKDVVKCVKSLFRSWDIEDPSSDVHDAGYRIGGMNYFLDDVLPGCDAGVFMPYPDGMWGYGMYAEARCLRAAGRPIFQVGDNFEVSCISLPPESKMLSIHETRHRNKRWDLLKDTMLGPSTQYNLAVAEFKHSLKTYLMFAGAEGLGSFSLKIVDILDDVGNSSGDPALELNKLARLVVVCIVKGIHERVKSIDGMRQSEKALENLALVESETPIADKYFFLSAVAMVLRDMQLHGAGDYPPITNLEGEVL